MLLQLLQGYGTKEVSLCSAASKFEGCQAVLCRIGVQPKLEQTDGSVRETVACLFRVLCFVNQSKGLFQGASREQELPFVCMLDCMSLLDQGLGELTRYPRHFLLLKILKRYAEVWQATEDVCCRGSYILQLLICTPEMVGGDGAEL